MSTSRAGRSQFAAGLLLWCGLTLLVVSVNADGLLSSRWLFPPHIDVVLNPAIWNPPLGNFIASIFPTGISSLIAAGVFGLSLTGLCQLRSPDISELIVVCWVAAVAICLPLEHVVTFSSLVAAIHIHLHAQCWSTKRILPLWIVATGAVLTTCESSFWPLFVLGLPVCRGLSRRSVTLSATCSPWNHRSAFLMIIVAALVWPAFRQSMLVPVWRVTILNHWASYAEALWLPPLWQRTLLICSLLPLLAMSVRAVSARKETTILHWMMLASVVLLTTGGYENLLFGGCILLATSTEKLGFPGSIHRVSGAFALLGILIFAGYLYGNSADAFIVDSTDREILPVEWTSPARVMLVDLNQSRDWYGYCASRGSQLILDHRQVTTAVFRQYSAVCDDVRQSRKDRYLRGDGTWGGYGDVLKEWQPDLIVLNSLDVDGIRSLAMDPEWKLISLDAKKTVFSSVDSREFKAHMRRASELLRELEFPSGRSFGELRETLRAGTRSDFRNVAAVLNAMRLPYAALRFLPADQAPSTMEVRTWSFIELAHREKLHSGQMALLNHIRAISGINHLQEQPWYSAAVKMRLNRAMGAISAAGIAFRDDGVRSNNGGLQSAETNFRMAIGQGKLEAARDLIKDLEVEQQALYSLLLESGQHDANWILKRLLPALEQETNPETRHEGLFYAGCLAVELGDIGAAVEYFQRSSTEDPSGPFCSLGRFFESQLVPAR